ncbi:hypothetical protein [Thiomonas sp. FB-Cd]|uniref:DUF7714 family protein n=1 Tax=Thiomonas sp. FB-Cd TaxID=1158292 RepID=UPI0006895C36|nr:hypothetical protein [Thiomonas sp. FB-Cd]
MDKAQGSIAGLRNQRNLVPLPYRQVSVQPYAGAMTQQAITQHLMGREAYRRTNFIVLHGGSVASGALAVVAVERRSDEPLFSPIIAVEVLSLPETTTFVHDAATDCANRSALALCARQNGVTGQGTVVVQGRYDHINFIHHPDPLVLRIVEVAPPEPPKLFDLVRHVLSYADLPAIVVELERIEIAELARKTPAEEYLVPCRSGGLDQIGGHVSFLDERPAERRAWTLIGCERSLQFHRHYYGDEPPRIEMCPRRIAGNRSELTMLKCCLLEFDIERDGQTMVVPWGTDLAMVERALRQLVDEVGHDR